MKWSISLVSFTIFIIITPQILLKMKSLKLFSLAVLGLMFSVAASAQSTTETFKVNGNCGMCKSAIEKAAKAAGAENASWNKESKELTVSYLTASTDAAKIQQKIADAGYDNAGFKTTDVAYNKLPGCCKYDRSVNVTAAKEEASCCKKDGDKMDDTKGCKGSKDNMDCCKDGKCTKPGHDGKDCCKQDGDKMQAGKDGKAAMSCCKKAD